MNNFPHYHQLNAMDCGATCLRMIAKHYGKSYTSQTLRKRSYITREGVSLGYWQLTRNKVEICNNCVAKYLCTPISNYELITKKYNKCKK